MESFSLWNIYAILLFIAVWGEYLIDLWIVMQVIGSANSIVTIFKPSISMNVINSQVMFIYLIFIDWKIILFTVANEKVMHDLGGCWRVSENCYEYSPIGSCHSSFMVVQLACLMIALAGEFPTSPLQMLLFCVYLYACKMCCRMQKALLMRI